MFKRIFKKIEEMNNKLLYGEEVNEEDVESYIGMFALLYVAANIDNQIDKSEEQIINLYKYNIARSLDRPNKEQLRDVFYEHAKQTDEIEANKKTIQIHEALNYFPKRELSQKTKDTLKKLVTEIVEVDGVVTEEEETFIKCINLFIEKGHEAILEIEKLECS